MKYGRSMNVLKSKWFNKWARKARISDRILVAAVDAIDESSVVDLGSGLCKLRLARQHQGKSGGFRTIVIYRKGNLALFVLGFAKNERDNIGASDLTDLKKQAKHILQFSRKQIEQLIKKGTFVEVEVNNE